ncbi:hypothetical protein BAMA111019_10240 [Bacillus manliponensis]
MFVGTLYIMRCYAVWSIMDKPVFYNEQDHRFDML